MDFEQARFNMVEQQIRTWEVLDPTVLELLFSVKREDFVPPEFRSLAFADVEIPLGFGQKMWAPKMEARVLQELDLKPDDSVLEVGSGSGYLTALLASRAQDVISVEIVPELREAARARLQKARIDNVGLELGDASRGWGERGFDAIVLTGSTPILPESWLQQLNPGGRLFAVVGDVPAMSARLLRWTAPGAVASEDLFETVIAPLVNAPQPERFVF
jgi:protein-L-isoaspartate(D-aspartate) O-methyltransferase